MDHIKNSPNLPDSSAFELGGAGPAFVLDLEHPNTIGDLTPWQVDFRQVDPGRLSTTITVRAGRSVSALGIAMTQRVHQRGASPDGWTTLGIPERGTIESWKGKHVTRDAFLSFGDSDGFDGVTTAGFAGNVISFETRQLQGLAQTCGFHLDDNAPEAHMVRSQSGLASLVLLERRISNLLTDPNSNWTAATEETLMLEALTILTDGEAHLEKSQVATRRRALNRAIDLMLANLDEPILIQELCIQCGASWRTLDRAFKEQFGCGPKTYFMRLRLNRVREGLLNASPDETITEVANRNGFWHIGQFAKDYRLFFGERPSDTKTRRHNSVRPRRI